MRACGQLFVITTVLIIAELLACSSGDSPTPGPIATQATRPTAVTELAPTLATVTPVAAAKVPLVAQPSNPARPAEVNLFSSWTPIPMTEAPERDIYQLAVELVPGLSAGFPRIVVPDSHEFTTGRVDIFWLLDLPTLKIYRSAFELRLITNHAYWYVEEGQSIRQEDLERAAATFEEEIYPRVTQVFGTEWSPGVDNDPRLNVLNAKLRAVGGYYTSSDEYPNTIFPFSNQREIIYVNTNAYSVGTSGYNRTLAHELQHAIHWNGDHSEETWLNEGLSELAVTVAGYGQDSVDRFLRGGPTSLVNWPLSPDRAGVHYGASSLFMHYLREHYATPLGLRLLLAEPGDGIIGIDNYLAASGFDFTFRDVFGDWVVANLLDEANGKYGHSGFEALPKVQNIVDSYSEFISEIPQYAVEYVEFTSFSGPLRLSFQGNTETALLPVDTGPQGCWWGNSGDSINSTLTRPLDLRGMNHVRLNFEIWYSLEDLWDYGYLEVSTNGGRKWNILETPHTSAANPVGNSFGMGYTGESGGWIEESVDLTPYAGQEILLRFQYVTDDAVNGAGFCLRGISVPEIQLGPLTGEWAAEGFILIDNRVAQDYIVQVVEMAGENRVSVMKLDGSNDGEVLVDAPQALDRLVVAVAALAPKTLQPATYTLIAAPPE